MNDQQNLFSGVGPATTKTAHRLDLIDADVVYVPDFIPESERDRLLADLTQTTAWQQTTFKIYGKEVQVPRLIAWHGDPDRPYSYSNLMLAPQPWTPVLLDIKAQAEAQAGTRFNSVLLNSYRTGQDSVSWHSDDEPELGPAPVIASVSLGAARTFQLRHRANKALRYALVPADGSLLLMRGLTQRCWHHQVPKTARPVGPRINLTFRTIG